MRTEEPSDGDDVTSKARARASELVGRTLLLRYRIEELIALGGLGAVFRAQRLATGEEVAVKVLQPEMEGLPELIERFEREAVAGKHILCPNVAAVYEIDQLDDGSWFLVQEFIRGKTLREVIDQGPLKPRRAARIARQLAVALNAAHDLGIVHRDVKPRNIMVLDGTGHPGTGPRAGPDEPVKLIDFGLAKVPIERLDVAAEGRRSLTQAGVVLGTVAYMAPEAALGMRSIDRRSDLYALGLILYEMLAGKHAFSAKDAGDMFRQQRQALPPRISERTPGVEVPDVLEAVVQRLLEKDPDARYPHARAVIVALDEALAELGPEAASRSSSGPGRGRSRALVLGIVLAVLLLAGALAWFFLLR